MNALLSTAILVLIASIVYVLIRWGNLRCQGSSPVGFFAFMAILFTSGLDMGLIILPLTEFPIYSQEAEYSFANPFTIEFGFWGFYIWSFYFITSFYFCCIEPRVRIFELPVIKWANNVVIVATCAFTAYLFLINIDWYMPDLTSQWHYALLFLILLFAVYSSTDIKFVKVLSLTSTYLFFVLIFGMWVSGDQTTESLFAVTTTGVLDYFANLPQFLLPFNDYHAFYLFWWFSWSIMIGQFVSRFVGGLRTYQLLLALLIVPSIPLAIWFGVLYHYHLNEVVVSNFWKLSMTFLGIVFVINSVDSLVRLYSDNMGLTVEKLGKKKYIATHLVFLILLVALFQFTPFKIQWVGLIVIGLFAVTLVLLVFHHKKLRLISKESSDA